jgi:hypothetical protein
VLDYSMPPEKDDGSEPANNDDPAEVSKTAT